MNDINYHEKFANFQAITENNDPDVAMRYLQESNWDEHEASKNYFKNINRDLNRNNNNNLNNNNLERDKNFYQENLIPNDRPQARINSDQTSNYDRIGPNRNISVNSNITRQTRHNGGLINTIKNLFCCGQTRDEEEEATLNLSVFENIPGKVDSFNEFTMRLKEKLGIIFVYKEKDREFTNFIEKIKTLDHIVDILKENFINHPVTADSEIHRRINFLVGIKTEDIVVPSIIFVSHKTSNNNNLTRQSVIDKIVGYVSTEIFYESLVKCVDQVNLPKTSVTSNNTNSQKYVSNNIPIQQKENSYIPPSESNYAIIQEQKEELLNLMREEEEKKKKQIEEENNIQREKDEKVRLEQEKEEMRKKKINSLPQEPEQGNKDATFIVFRHSDGNGRSERRFLKTEKVAVLYDFIDTLGNIFHESDKYDLIQTFPRKVYDDRTKTLEEEGLFPNAVLQIREI